MAAPAMDFAPLPGEETKALAPVQAAPVAGPGETASTAVATMARSQVEARYVMAMRNPRSMMTVRAKLLDACKRTRFAQTARYAKPVGNSKVVGWSIRFAEEVARCLGNVLVEASVTFDDRTTRIIRVMVTDLESNISYPFDVSVAKTVERSKPDGKEVLGQRLNSQGRTTYIVAATEDDLLNKQNALVSKAMRTGILRIIPADILEEAEEQVADTLAADDAQDPGAKAKKIADLFYALGVMPSQVEGVLGHPLTASTPAEVTLMRTWYTAMKEGETSWRDIEEAFGHKPSATAAGEPEPSAKGTAGLKAKLAKEEKPTEGALL